MIAGILRPTSGRVRVAGYDVAIDPIGAKRALGFIPDRPIHLRKAQRAPNSCDSSRDYSDNRAHTSTAAARSCSRCRLEEWRDALVESYSHGMRQKLIIGPLDIPAPVRPPQPRIQVNPNVLRKIAPPALPAPIPQPEVQPQPKQELPSAPAPQTPAAPQPKTEIASNNPLKAGDSGYAEAAARFDSSEVREHAPDGLGAAPRSAVSFRTACVRFRACRCPRSVGGGGGQSGRALWWHGDVDARPGVDFSAYLARVQTSVDRNWQAVIPESVQLGEKGWVELQFKIMRDGSVPPGYPILIRSFEQEPLDRAAVSSIRASNPFEPLPSAFTGPYIELRAIYLYNLPPEILNQQ